MYGGSSGAHTQSISANVSVSCQQSIQYEKQTHHLYELNVTNVVIKSSSLSPVGMPDKSLALPFRFLRDLKGNIPVAEVTDTDQTVITIKKAIAEVISFSFYKNQLTKFN